MGNNIITINGRAYDAISGMPAATGPQATPSAPPHKKVVHKPATPSGKPMRAFSDIGPAKPSSHIAVKKPVQAPAQATATAVKAPVEHALRHQTPHKTVHKPLQKSQTLHRAALKKPQFEAPSPAVAATKYSRSPSITKFAPQPEEKASAQLFTPLAPTEKPETPQLLQHHAELHKTAADKPKSKHMDSKALKEHLIKERIAEAEAAKAQKPKKQSHFQRLMKRQPKLTSVLTSTFALLLLGGYLTYINLPNLSMKVAAMRAGISASYPTYKPDGYSLNGAIAYSPGEVNIAFKSNTNNQTYNIRQQASSWDSQAVLDNYVSKQTQAYLTFQERGLTVYTYGNKAAWVNGGLMYTIEGDAPLNSEQILKIASSM